MSRWLPKEERIERDNKVVELYNQGFTCEVISLRCGLAAHSGAVNHILVRHGIVRNRLPSKGEREERDRKALELYRQGVSHVDIRISLGVNISKILKRHGLKADRR